MEGSLYKWTNYASGWQKRWFVLDKSTNCLSYYITKSSVDRSCRGSINLCDANVSVNQSDNCQIVIKGKSCTIFVRAETLSERQRWVLAMSSVAETFNRHMEERDNITTLGLLHKSIENVNLYRERATNLLYMIENAYREQLTASTCSSSKDNNVKFNKNKKNGTYRSVRDEDLTLFNENSMSMLSALDKFMDLVASQKRVWNEHLEFEIDKRHQVEAELSSLSKEYNVIREQERYLLLLTDQYESLQNESCRSIDIKPNVPNQMRRLGSPRLRSSSSLSLGHLSQHRLSSRSSPLSLRLEETDSEWEDDDFYDAEDEPTDMEAVRMVSVLSVKELLKTSDVAKDVNDLDDASIVRFLIARNYNISKASEMVRRFLLWREKFRPRTITMDDIAVELAKGTMFIHRCDKAGRPLIIFNIGKNNLEETNKETYIRMVVLFVETAIRTALPSIGTFTLVIDFEGYSLANNDLGTTKEIFKLLSDFYPERLGCCYLVDTPWVFSAFWYAVRGLLSERTLSKIKQVSRVQLTEYIEAECLPRCLGGTSNYTYEADVGGSLSLGIYPEY